MLTILFLCTSNSCRSQMAEALAHDLYPQHIFYSAGIKTHGINSHAIKVIEELGLDMSSQYSKHIDTLQNINFDVIITVCNNAKESCPLFMGKALKLHHSFQDPPTLAANIKKEAEKLRLYRKVRDEIKHYLVAELPQLVKGLV